MSGGGAAVPHAGRRVRERVLTPEILLHLWVPHPGFSGGHLSSHRLQELRHAASVSQPVFNVIQMVVNFFYLCGFFFLK